MTAERLGGRTILIAEDEALVAMDLVDMVEMEGAAVVGPCVTVEACLAASDDGELPDAAILDVRLGQKEIFGVAEQLRSKGVPIVFHSGHMGIEELNERFPEAAFCSKPTTPEDLISALEDVIRGRRAA